MSASTREIVKLGTRCEDIYENIINELKKEPTIDQAQIENKAQGNPFAEETSSGDSVDTFVPVGNLGGQIYEKTLTVFGNLPQQDSSTYIEQLEIIKKSAKDLTTGFRFSSEPFLHFLRSYFEKTRNFSDPIDNFGTFLERKGNKRLVSALTTKYFRVFLFQQLPTNVSFFEISMIYNLAKLYFENLEYVQLVLRIALKSYVTAVSAMFSDFVITDDFVNEFSKIFETIINALNGAISEIGVQEEDVDRIIFVMLAFKLEDKQSIFLKYFSAKELFYCALRSIRQGHDFAKKLECFILTKLRWRLTMDEEEYTIDKLYQTIFKYEFKKIIGAIRRRPEQIVKQPCQTVTPKPESDDEGKDRILITKVVQTTPKSKGGKDTYSFSPLSKRIGEATKNRESLDSKRKLKFE